MHYAPLTAGEPWAWAVQLLDGQDLATLHPLIEALLKDDAVGTRLAWHSPSGKAGNIYLESGGELAGLSEATVRITTETKGHETRLIVFRYRKDPEMGWGLVG
jgi:hypothetical protein